MKIAFIVPYPLGKAPSQRFRFEQQLESFKEKKITYIFFSFLSDKAFDNLYKKGNYFSKVVSIFYSFLKRLLLMFSLGEYNYIFIHREASPIGPPIFEWIIAKVLKKKIIYDFDDAIWLPNTSEANKIVSKIKWHRKVKSICKWSFKISCGNQYLVDYAKQYSSNVSLIPTTVDMLNVHNETKNQQTKNVVVGWTGTHSTIKYLYDIEDLISKLQNKFDFKFYVISNKDPKFKKLNYKYITWKKETEIEDLLLFNIGIMPLKNNVWAKGKCGFKAIQYMSLGIPAIVSDVGVNSTIVIDKTNGFVCHNNKEWEFALKTLIESVLNRKGMGIKAKQQILNFYSTKSVEKKYLSLFNFTT